MCSECRFGFPSNSAIAAKLVEITENVEESHRESQRISKKAAKLSTIWMQLPEMLKNLKESQRISKNPKESF